MQVPNKYNRTIYDVETDGSVTVDVYAVLEAFKVTCPARQHAIKKLLCAGLRGKGDSVQDLTEAGEAIARAVRLEKRNSVLRGSAFLVQGDNAPPTKWLAGVIETECRICRHKMNHPIGYTGDCICPACREVPIKPPETLPPEGTCNTPCTKCGRLINYALGSAPIPRRCSKCRKKRDAKVQRVYGRDVPPDETLTDDADWDWEEEPERGELHVYRSAEYIHTTCKTCNNKVTYTPGVKRPDLCRLCVPVTETGPDAPPPVESPEDKRWKEGFDDDD